MKNAAYHILLTFGLLFFGVLSAQTQNRISYNNQDLFLSGANLAWLDFARDIGPGETQFDLFGEIMLDMHDHGGNALRWWLHTNGAVSPEFDANGMVSGPGAGTIADLRQVLDLAWEREIGLKLCLWSFDMLRSSNSAAMLNRNTLMLTDTAYTNAYINNCLIPMVDSLSGHPAIIAWEIFNEPEGMSDEFGWAAVEHVPMSAIQRMVNLCAGAIHRTDPQALVTNGAWSFLSLANPDSIVVTEAIEQYSRLSNAERADIERRFAAKYRFDYSSSQILEHMIEAYAFRQADSANFNYYADSSLIAEGGDQDGTLDFFSVHYYDWGGTAISPFHFSASSWSLDKPIVVAEFHMQETFGIAKEDLFARLHLFGYAGALPWSWTDPNFSTRDDMLAGMQYMWDNHRADVDVLGIAGAWPTVTLLSPDSNAVFPDSAEIVIEAEASDSDGSIVLVEFYASDTLKIGEVTDEPYTITWTNIPPDRYTLKAVATDDQGNERTSNRVQITVGTPLFAHLEAEAASRSGSGFSVLSDPLASNGHYVEMRTNTGTVTWTLANVGIAGSYEIRFGYRLSFDSPKTQFVNVNGSRVGEIVFQGAQNVWREEAIQVDLNAGSNEIQMELSWGWMDLDYLGIPADLLITPIAEPGEVPLGYHLQQNFPNPFNPSTTFRYSLARRDLVELVIFDALGREVEILFSGYQSAGMHQFAFDARHLSSGVYFYRLRAGAFMANKRMLLLK